MQNHGNKKRNFETYEQYTAYECEFLVVVGLRIFKDSKI